MSESSPFPPPEPPEPVARSGEPIEIAEPDPRWPRRFEAERVRLDAALADEPHSVEHVGSTAVPGLAAKPVIDVLLGLERWPMRAEAIAAVACRTIT